MARLSVPGKVILIGEHAAVYGRPALVAAIDLRTTAEVTTPPAGAGWELELDAISYRGRLSADTIERTAGSARAHWQRWSEGAAPFTRPPAGPEWLVVLALGEALGALEQHGLARPADLRLVLRSELPIGGGMGSSAAAAVAVIAGVLRHGGLEPAPALVDALALEVERRQHGRPSGVDAATVLRGGVIWVERAPAGELRLGAVELGADALSRLMVFDSGAPAESTGEVVDGVRQRGESMGPEFARVLDDLAAAAVELRRALASGGDCGAPQRAAHRSLSALGVVPAGVAERVERIEALGGSAKISGAGSLRGPGAGAVLVYHPEPARLVAAGALAGWRRHGAALLAPGLTIDG